MLKNFASLRTLYLTSKAQAHSFILTRNGEAAKFAKKFSDFPKRSIIDIQSCFWIRGIILDKYAFKINLYYMPSAGNKKYRDHF